MSPVKGRLYLGEVSADMNPNPQTVTDAGTADVVARPPILFLAALLLGFVVDHLLPLPRPIPATGPAHSISAVVAGCLVLGGLALFVAGIRNFLRAGTPVPTTAPTRVLVTAGIHAWTRNPIYVGLFALYVGIAIAVRSPWVLILAVPLVIAIRYGVVAREEAYLQRRFGDAYLAYKDRVRRWL